MSTPHLLVLLALVTLLSASGSSLATTESVSVFVDEHGQFGYSLGRLDSDAPASGTFQDYINKTGWARLKVWTNSSYPDTVQAYAAGFAEGTLTYQRIWENYQNLIVLRRKWMNEADIPAKLVSFLEANQAYIKSNIASQAGTSPYWAQVAIVFAQAQGLADGFNKVAAARNRSLSHTQFLVLNSLLDLDDILAAVDPSTRPNFENMTAPEFEQWLALNSHCSALVKVKDDLSDIFWGHTTWSTYLELMKIFKTYTFHLSATNGTSATTVHFSSRPGILSSIDDFYLMDSGLASMETTLEVFNQDLYSNVKPTDQLLYWYRVTIANRMATTPRDWVDTFSQYNSGTYNNQWMVLHLDAFQPGQDLPAGFFYVLEQLPGHIESADMTDILAMGYWPSYNVPWFPTVFSMAGYPQQIAKEGPDMLSYDTCVRAKIFRRDHHNVQDIEGLKTILRYNDYQNDPFSKGNPGYAISARNDLNKDRPGCSGGGDSKVSSFSLYSEDLTALAQAGPTHDQQPAFNFATTAAKCGAQIGMPDLWDFPFVKFQGLNSYANEE